MVPSSSNHPETNVIPFSSPAYRPCSQWRPGTAWRSPCRTSGAWESQWTLVLHGHCPQRSAGRQRSWSSGWTETQKECLGEDILLHYMSQHLTLVSSKLQTLKAFSPITHMLRTYHRISTVTVCWLSHYTSRYVIALKTQTATILATSVWFCFLLFVLLKRQKNTLGKTGRK